MHSKWLSKNQTQGLLASTKNLPKNQTHSALSTQQAHARGYAHPHNVHCLPGKGAGWRQTHVLVRMSETHKIGDHPRSCMCKSTPIKTPHEHLQGATITKHRFACRLCSHSRCCTCCSACRGAGQPPSVRPAAAGSCGRSSAAYTRDCHSYVLSVPFASAVCKQLRHLSVPVAHQLRQPVGGATSGDAAWWLRCTVDIAMRKRACMPVMPA